MMAGRMERGHQVGNLRKKHGESGAWSASGRENENDGMILNDGTVDLIIWSGLALRFTCFWYSLEALALGWTYILCTHTYTMRITCEYCSYYFDFAPSGTHTLSSGGCLS